MIYITADFENNVGNHGHQLKDFFALLCIAKFFNFKYIHTHCEYLEFFSVGFGEMKIDELSDDIKVLKVAGLRERNIPKDRRAVYKKKMFNLFSNIKGRYNSDCLIIVSGAMRILTPIKILELQRKGEIKTDIFNELIVEASGKFNCEHGNSKTYFSDNKISIAMHISRGQDYDEEKFPKHFSNHSNCRFMFPVKYYANIINKLVDIIGKKNYEIHIYTEKLNSEEIVAEFGDKKNIVLHLGDNRNQKNYKQIHEIFHHFVMSDILVTCNSSFSTMAAYFRKNKPTIYHPHASFHDISSENFIPTNEEGEFDLNLLNNFIVNYGK